MDYITEIENYHGTKKTAVTIGKFDGLHRGHQKLVDKIRDYASDECDSVLCAFDMHRDAIMTNRERREHLEGKIDCLIDCPFTETLRNMEAEDFIRDILCAGLNAAHIVVGRDFAFGHNKRGSVEMLERYAPQYGYTVDVVEKERYGDMIISSTYIREELDRGNVEKANELLGEPYAIHGRVVHGNHIGGSLLGFPTANIVPPSIKRLPRFGVYVSRVLVDGCYHRGVTNIGKKPTIQGEYPAGAET